MRGEDVLEVLDLLAAAGVVAWLDGGWGVDALLGEQTRDHADLDLAVPLSQELRFREALASRGFREVSAEPHNPVFEDARGRTVDAHFVDLERTSLREDGARVYGAIAYEVGAFEGSGTVLGRRVACCTADFQVRSHASGYTPDEDDYRDVIALHHRFGTPLPPVYAEWTPAHAKMPGEAGEGHNSSAGGRIITASISHSSTEEEAQS